MTAKDVSKKSRLRDGFKPPPALEGDEFENPGGPSSPNSGPVSVLVFDSEGGAIPTEPGTVDHEGVGTVAGFVIIGAGTVAGFVIVGAGTVAGFVIIGGGVKAGGVGVNGVIVSGEAIVGADDEADDV